MKLGLIFIICLSTTDIVKGQIFFVRPVTNESKIFFSRDAYDIKVGSYFYILGSEGFDSKKDAYDFCINKAKLLGLKKVDWKDFKDDNIYNSFCFTDSISYSVVQKDCRWALKEDVYKRTFLGKSLVVQFEKDIDTIFFENKINIIRNDSLTVNLGASNKYLAINGKKSELSTYHGMTVCYQNGEAAYIYMVMTQDGEFADKGYYIVLNEDHKVTQVYNFYRPYIE